jgi:Protein of unknown function (DUF3305)
MVFAVYSPRMEQPADRPTSHPTTRLAIVMERRAINNRWQPYQWQAAGALPDTEVSGSAPQTIVNHDGLLQRLYPGMEVSLYRDEAEGYFLNLTSPAPKIFVMWRLNDEALGTESEAEPFMLTLSYNEAARWMDAQEKVEGVPMLPELLPGLAEFVELHYKPEPKKQRIRPKSFESKEGRYRNMG